MPVLTRFIVGRLALAFDLESAARIARGPFASPTCYPICLASRSVVLSFIEK